MSSKWLPATVSLTALVIFCALILASCWPQLTGHRLNGEPCGHPPASLVSAGKADQRDERDCGAGIEPEDRPGWCC